MSATPRPTWYAGEYGCRQDMYAASVALPIFNQHDALVAKVAAYEEFVEEVRIEHPESDDGENFCSKCRDWNCYALLALKQLAEPTS